MERWTQDPEVSSASRCNDVGEAWWSHARVSLALVRIVVPVLIALTLVRFGFELWRMLNAPGAFAGNDLYTRYGETQRWFADVPVYTHRRHAGYPPASYVLFWPLLGWLPWTTVRWLWVGLNLGALAVGIPCLVRYGAAEGRRAQALLALALLAPYPLAVTLGNGQLGILTLAALLAGVFLLEKPPTWRRDLVAAALLLFALLKPSLTAPLFLLVLSRTGQRWRPALLVVLGYAALTVLASSFRSQPLAAELSALAEISSQVVLRIGHGHLPLWLGELGLGHFSSWATLLALLGLGVWLASHRHADLWSALGVTAIWCRLASYHGVYDDSLVLLAIVALFRAATQAGDSRRRRTWARILLLLAWLPLLLPATMATMGLPWSMVHHGLAPLVWLAAAIYLATYAQARSVATSPG